MKVQTQVKAGGNSLGTKNNSSNASTKPELL